jgi:hypothetical protein
MKVQNKLECLCLATFLASENVTDDHQHDTCLNNIVMLFYLLLLGGGGDKIRKGFFDW